MFKQKKRRSRAYKNSDKVINLEQARVLRHEKRKQVVAKKQNKAKKSASVELSERKVNKRNRKRLIYFFIILAIMVVIGMSIFHVYSLRKEYENIIVYNKELKDEKQDIIEELGNVNNPEYIEQQAREQLKMIKPGEILYILPHENAGELHIVSRENVKLLPAGEESD